MDDDKYTVAFELITKAGDAKSKAMVAIEAAREFEFEEAEKYLKEAEQGLKEAHDAQLDMMQKEASGTPADVNIILVHAQDHLTMAIKAHDNGEEFINLYKLIRELKEEK